MEGRAKREPGRPCRIRPAGARDARFARAIAAAIGREVDREALGLARRSPALIREAMVSGRAVIALAGKAWVGFCYACPWDGGRFVSTSALIVKRSWRGRGIARGLKESAFALCRRRWPRARIFGLTTSPAVMRINESLGLVPVGCREIARDPGFWKGCEDCPFHGELLARRRRSCRCTAMAEPPGRVPIGLTAPGRTARGAPPRRRRARG